MSLPSRNFCLVGKIQQDKTLLGVCCSVSGHMLTRGGMGKTKMWLPPGVSTLVGRQARHGRDMIYTNSRNMYKSFYKQMMFSSWLRVLFSSTTLTLLVGDPIQLLASLFIGSTTFTSTQPFLPTLLTAPSPTFDISRQPHIPWPWFFILLVLNPIGPSVFVPHSDLSPWTFPFLLVSATSSWLCFLLSCILHGLLLSLKPAPTGPNSLSFCCLHLILPNSGLILVSTFSAPVPSCWCH